VAEFAQLRGGVNEVPNGDHDGRGSATVIIPNAGDSGKLCFAILVLGIGKPTAAHIHKAPVGKAGPVVVPLRAPANGDPGALSVAASKPTRRYCVTSLAIRAVTTSMSTVPGIRRALFEASCS
jgi:hypothetical protein